jgi:hypothetical protein
MATPGARSHSRGPPEPYFFRVDRSGSVRRILVVAGLLVTVGASLIGGHLVTRLGIDLGHTVSLIGGLIVVSGLILGFGGMALLVFENVYVLIEDEGLLCHENGKETKIPWSELERVEIDKVPGFLRFVRKEGAPVRWFMGSSARDVREKVEESRRKALHGLFRSPRSTPPRV